jgi:hypothetical protein
MAIPCEVLRRKDAKKNDESVHWRGGIPDSKRA